MQATVALFDIDGTLVTAHGVGKHTFVQAFAAETRSLFASAPIAGEVALNFSFGGMTDFAIARRGLVNAGLACEQAVMERIVARYLDALAVELAQTDENGDPILTLVPGAADCVAAVSKLSHVALGLGTGNVRRGAQLKLEPHDLWAPFAFGGFGCDAEDRAELLRCGAQRGASELGIRLQDARIVVIGDTLRDVAAAIAIGATCIGIATGRDTAEALCAAGATHAFPTLESAELLRAIGG